MTHPIPVLKGEEKEFWHLETIQKAAVVISVLTLVISLFLWPTLPVGLGVLSGSAIGLLNFRLLRRMVTKILDEKEDNKKRNGLRFILKIIGLVAAVGILILVIKVNPIAFVVGFSSIVLAIFYEGMKSLF